MWFANPGPAEKVRDNKVYRRLDVRTEGRDVFLPENGELYEATSFISVLSIPLLRRRAGAQAGRRRGRRSGYRDGLTSPRSTSARSKRTGCSSWA